MLNLKLWMQKVSELLKSLKDTVAGHTSSISSLNTTVSSHTTTINNHTSTINSHTSTINSHTSSINNHTSRISTLQGRIGNVKIKYGQVTNTNYLVKDGGSTAIETLIPYSQIPNIKDVVTADNFVGVEVWLGALKLPYVNNGTVQTWVNMDWKSGSISILNKTTGWHASKYAPKILLYYV